MILVVDDNDFNVSALECMLETFAQVPETASDGQSALDIVKKRLKNN